jgi:hypothetical protein
MPRQINLIKSNKWIKVLLYDLRRKISLKQKICRGTWLITILLLIALINQKLERLIEVRLKENLWQINKLIIRFMIKRNQKMFSQLITLDSLQIISMKKKTHRNAHTKMKDKKKSNLNRTRLRKVEWSKILSTQLDLLIKRLKTFLIQWKIITYNNLSLKKNIKDSLNIVWISSNLLSVWPFSWQLF